MKEKLIPLLEKRLLGRKIWSQLSSYGSHDPRETSGAPWPELTLQINDQAEHQLFLPVEETLFPIRNQVRLISYDKNLTGYDHANGQNPRPATAYENLREIQTSLEEAYGHALRLQELIQTAREDTFGIWEK